MMGSPTLIRRVLLVGAVIVAGVLTAGVAVGATVVQFQNAEQQHQRLTDAAQADAEMLKRFVDEETGYRGYLITEDPAFLEPYNQAQAALPTITETFRQSFAASGGPTRLAQDLDEAHDAWSLYVRQQLDRVADGNRDDAFAAATTGQGKALFDAIRARDDAVTSWLSDATANTQQQMTELQQRLTALLVLTLAALVAIVVGGIAMLWTTVARPLARLAAATRTVADGDLSADLPAAGAPEVRSLAADVRAMRDRLTADLHTTRQSLDALEQAEPTVAALRTALQPVNEPVPGLTTVGRLDPAEGVLAGDWYDAIALSPTRLALVLGDVAGHGPTSAVFALRLKHSLLTALRAGLDPGQALTQVSTELADVPPGQFATALIAIFDTATGTMAYANAGHPAGLLLDGPAEPGDFRRLPSSETRLILDGDHPVRWIEVPSTGPLLSSIVSGWAWNTASRPFGPGDALLAFTDGVLESRDGEGREFGTEGILNVITEVGLGDESRLIDAIAAASMRFGGNRPRRDDHTLVYVGRPAPQPAAATPAPGV